MATTAVTIKVLFKGQSHPTTFTLSPPQNSSSSSAPFKFKTLPTTSTLIASNPHIREFTQNTTSGSIYNWGKSTIWRYSFPIFFCHPESESGSEDKPILVLKTACHVDDGDMNYIEDAVDCLETEAVFYNESLASLQGLLVPHHYGMWQSDATEFAGVMRCEILEYCGRNLNSEPGWTGSMEQRNQLAEAAEKLHDWGIYHNQLVDDQLLRHTLWREKDQQLVFIDFVRAVDAEECTRRIPLCTMRPFHWLKGSICEELQEIGNFLELRGRVDGYSEELLKKAMDWLAGQRHCWENGDDFDWVVKEEKHREQKKLLQEWAKEESAKNLVSPSKQLPTT